MSGRRLIQIGALCAMAVPCAAQADPWPIRLPAPGGEVVLPDAAAQRAFDEGHYAAVRRVGDLLFLSGVIVYRRPDEARDAAALRQQVDRALDRLEGALIAAGSDWSHVVSIGSYHVWDSPDFTGDRNAQFAVLRDALAARMSAPWPAWTAIGSTGTLAGSGIMEIELVAAVREGPSEQN